MKKRTKVLVWLLALVMMIALLPAAALAEGEEPVPAELLSWSGNTLTFGGVAGQEYAIAERNGTLDWSTAVQPNEDGIVLFTDLLYATTYHVFTRLIGGDGRAA